MSKVHEIITDKILSLINTRQLVPWRATWKTVKGNPLNGQSKRAYSGFNHFFLSMSSMDYSAPVWYTIKQINSIGRRIKKGEAGSAVVFFTMWNPEEARENLPADGIPVLRYYYVWNLDQTEGEEVDLSKLPLKISGEGCQFSPIESAARIVDSWPDKPVIEHKGAQPYYRPGTDTVVMPAPDTFDTPEAYYATLFHELAHSTGHESRLNRDKSGLMTSDSYSFEELIAEFTSCYLCETAGITQPAGSPDYIAKWASRLKENKHWIVSAPAKAWKAAQMILSITPEQETAQ